MRRGGLVGAATRIVVERTAPRDAPAMIGRRVEELARMVAQDPEQELPLAFAAPLQAMAERAAPGIAANNRLRPDAVPDIAAHLMAAVVEMVATYTADDLDKWRESADRLEAAVDDRRDSRRADGGNGGREGARSVDEAANGRAVEREPDPHVAGEAEAAAEGAGGAGAGSVRPSGLRDDGDGGGAAGAAEGRA